MNGWDRLFFDVVKHTAKKTLDEKTYKKVSIIGKTLSIIVTIAMLGFFIFVFMIMKDYKGG